MFVKTPITFALIWNIYGIFPCTLGFIKVCYYKMYGTHNTKISQTKGAVSSHVFTAHRMWLTQDLRTCKALRNPISIYKGTPCAGFKNHLTNVCLGKVMVMSWRGVINVEQASIKQPPGWWLWHHVGDPECVPPGPRGRRRRRSNYGYT